jgi:predicted GNAT family acetyltransferase
MSHLLDNPIYHALTTAQQSMSKGNAAVKFYHPSIAAFAGLVAHNEENLELLYQLSAEESVFVIFSKAELPLNTKWELLTYIDMYQLVCESKEIPNVNPSAYIDLTELHVSEMKDLVELTKPGPFLDRTIEFGNYTGVFEANQLVAMAGQRFNPAPYREISAVCTHPEHLGNGYAYTLLQEQIKRILAHNEIPFLHVRADNEGAIRLYQKLGFVIRTEMTAYVIKKN